MATSRERTYACGHLSNIDNETLLEAINSIKGKPKTIERRKTVLKMRLGLEPYSKTYTLEEIGKQMGLSKERIRQYEHWATFHVAMALRRLKHDREGCKEEVNLLA